MIEEAFETPKISPDPDEVLVVASTMAGELRSLVSKHEVFRSIIVDGPIRRKQMLMSCGGLLARLHRLDQQRNQLSVVQEMMLTRAKEQMQITIKESRPSFLRILQNEANIRIESLEKFLDDGEKDRHYLCDEYDSEMRSRQRLEEVVKELGNKLEDDLAERVALIDIRIRTLCSPAPFIWDEALESVYPVDKYWYLYMNPIS